MASSLNVSLLLLLLFRPPYGLYLRLVAKLRSSWTRSRSQRRNSWASCWLLPLNWLACFSTSDLNRMEISGSYCKKENKEKCTWHVDDSKCLSLRKKIVCLWFLWQPSCWYKPLLLPGNLKPICTYFWKKKIDINCNYKLWLINLILNRTSDLKYLTETKIYKVFKNQLKMNF